MQRIRSFLLVDSELRASWPAWRAVDPLKKHEKPLATANIAIWNRSYKEAARNGGSSLGSAASRPGFGLKTGLRRIFWGLVKVRQALFEGRLSGASGQSGLYLGSRNGTILEIARTGQSTLGSTISALEFSPSNAREGSGLRGLNTSGQVAYYFQLADGRDGVALWSIPEPGGMLLIAIAVSALGSCGRRKR